MKTLRRALIASVAAAARSGRMHSRNGRASVTPTPRRKWRRLSSQFWRWMFMAGGGAVARLETIRKFGGRSSNHFERRQGLLELGDGGIGDFAAPLDFE